MPKLRLPVQVPPGIIILFNYMNACCFSQHLGLIPLQLQRSWQHNPIILLPTADLHHHVPLCHHPSSMSQAPYALTPGFQPWLATFHSAAQSSPQVSLTGCCPHFTPAFSSPFPTPVLRPDFLQWGPSIFATPNPQPQSFPLGCFSWPIYATSANKGQDPPHCLGSSRWMIQSTSLCGCAWRHQERCQKPPCSVSAAIDQRTISTDWNIKEISTKLTSLYQVCTNCSFPRVYNLAESGLQIQYILYKRHMHETTFPT